MAKYNMDGISDAYFSSDKQYKDYIKNVSGQKKENPPKQVAVKEADKRTNAATSSRSRHNNDRSKGQYEKILGISDPAFSGGDAFAAYGDYLKRIAKENVPPADDQSVIGMAVRTKTANNGSHRITAPEWVNSVSFPIQTTANAEQASTSPYSVGIMPVNQNAPRQILAQQAKEEQIANSMGAFRLAEQQADEKSARNARYNAATQIGKKAAQEHGLDLGSMPLSQHGSQATTFPHFTGIMPVNQDTPQQILTQRARQEQIANSMGAFRLAEQQADEKSANNARIKAAMEAGTKVAQEHGLDSGSMPLPQYGSQAKTAQYPTGILPANPNVKTTSSGQPVYAREAIDMAQTALEELGKEPGQGFSKAGGEVLGVAGDIICLVDFGSTIYDDLHDEDKKLGVKTASAVSASIGNKVGEILGTAVLLAVGTAIGVSTGGLAVLAFAGGLAGSELGEEFFRNIAETAYDRFTHPDPEGTAIKLSNAHSMMDDLSQYASDNRISSTMQYPMFYDSYKPGQSYLP